MALNLSQGRLHIFCGVEVCHRKDIQFRDPRSGEQSATSSRRLGSGAQSFASCDSQEQGRGGCTFFFCLCTQVLAHGREERHMCKTRQFTTVPMPARNHACLLLQYPPCSPHPMVVTHAPQRYSPDQTCQKADGDTLNIPKILLPRRPVQGVNFLVI